MENQILLLILVHGMKYFLFVPYNEYFLLRINISKFLDVNLEYSLFV